MITPEKTYTNNPFVDNIIYYSKLLAMNCSIKDEDEALANETKESNRRGDILISCIEGTANFELFDSYPKEILEKYIPIDSNLNMFVSNTDILKTYLNTFDQNQKTIYYNNLSEIARNVYMDHYIIMNNYIENISETWADDNEPLYNSCLGGSATYEDLFDIIPKYTRTRIILQYLNNYDNSDLTQYCNSLSEFQDYIDTRTDAQINTELANISKAMREVFISHYDIMVERGLIRRESDRRERYLNYEYLYNSCIDKSINFYGLYDAFPQNEIDNIIDTLFGDDYINNHIELTGLEFIDKYELKSDKDKLLEFASNFYTTLLNDIYNKYMEDNPDTVLDENGVNNDVLTRIMNSIDDGNFYFDAVKKLTEIFIDKYMENYKSYLDYDIYYKCGIGIIDYYELTKYLPIETQKMILNTQFKEFTNIEVYSRSKYMLNSFLTTLSTEDCKYIKNNITKDMIEWYPNHYEELNNYYRSFIGQPPIGEDGNVYEDTLTHSWNEKTKSFIEFGDYFLNKIPDNIYPEIHWKQKLCEFDNYDIGILTECGIIDEYALMCNSNINSSRYRYLKYLADNKLNIYQCRRAMQFDLIGIPTIDDEDARKRFVDAYFINREYIAKDVYSDAYKFQSDYYNKFIIIFILINTIMDMLSNITTMIIDREVFDYRCIKWLFESFGVPFYSEIPLKYLRAMLKNLNLLLKYKSSTKNMIDICKLFGFSDVRVFNYYLFKERTKDVNTGEYIFDEHNEISYDFDNLWVKVYTDQINIYPEDVDNICAAEPINGLFNSYEILNAEDPYDSYDIVKNKYYLYDDIKIRDEDLITYIDDLYSIDIDSTEPGSEKIFIKYTDNNLITDTSDNLNDNILHVVRDYNGVYYIKLLDYQHYDENKYTKEIYCMRNNLIIKKRIIKNDADVYIKDLNFNAFYRLQDSIYFSNIKANTDPAELKFVKVPINESLAEYKNDENYIVSYDDITLNDEGNTWDGGRIHEDLYQELVNHKFNVAKSKYISVETITDLTEQCFQVSYFYNMLFDNLYSEDLLTVKIPFIKIGHNFRFMDVICYLFSLMYFYNGLEDNIMYSPTQILFIKGYNFDRALNEISSNDFDINDEIENNNYNYQDTFKDYNIKAFNLEADIDELDKWLQENCYMSLDDFIIDDSLINFNQIITLRQFFTLNNSYYQKDIFKNNIITLPYNQVIKTAYGMELYSKIYITDMNDNIHEYIYENENWLEVINSFNNEIYLIDPNYYALMPDGKKYALYEKFILVNDIPSIHTGMHRPVYYYYDNGEFKLLFSNNIRVIDYLGRCVFSTDAIYSKNSNNEYIEITDNYLIHTYNSIKYIEWYPYWIKNNNDIWELNKDIAYIKVIQNGNITYIAYNEVHTHQNIEVTENDLWIKHSDGHFIKYTETDFYRTSHPEGIIDENIDNKIFEYDEEEGYIEVSSPIGAESDTDLNGNTRYFKKVSDFYNENNWNYNSDVLYFLIDDEYIPGYDLLSPYNCYINNDGNYELVINNYVLYNEYNTDSIKHTQLLLILQDNYDYKKYIKEYSIGSIDYNYFFEYIEQNSNKQYVYNSDVNYITALHSNDTYDETKSIITIFNKAITSSTSNNIISSGKYNPELTDKVWDENDWFYEDPNFGSHASLDIGIHGENIWYYRKPGSQIIPKDDIQYDPVGSGMYMESFAYIGDTHLIEGNRYYMAFDIETNFTGKIQIINTADNSIQSNEDKVYEVSKGDKQHISQVFIANDITTPEIRFIIYDFKQYPINIGDYIIISNIRFIKAYSDNFIAQDIPSYDKIQELYKTNEAIYKYIIKCMAEETDLNKYKIYKKIYDSLMISKYNKEAFKIGENKYAKTYTEFIKNRDAVLYARLNRFKNLDSDSMHKEIADEIVEITYAIDDCVDTYSYGFLYSYFPAISGNYIQQYITKLINWFKSWKVHLLGINTLYSLGDKSENTVKALEEQEYKIRVDNIKANCYIHGIVKINPLDDYNSSAISYRDIYNFDEYTNYLKDKCIPKDRVRIISTTANSLEYTDYNSKLKLIFNDIDTKSYIQNDNKMNISSGSSGFNIENNNDIIIDTDENEQIIISEQIIDEINLYSSDYIDWRSILNE